MIKIDYPPPGFRTKTENGTQMIFDALRRTWLKLTPEEWVRQNFVQFIISREVPASMIALEKKIMVGEMPKRFDIVIYDQHHAPWMIVECKATHISLTKEVLHQVLRYNLALPAKYLLVTNGSHCIGFENVAGKLEEVSDFPSW